MARLLRPTARILTPSRGVTFSNGSDGTTELNAPSTTLTWANGTICGWIRMTPSVTAQTCVFGIKTAADVVTVFCNTATTMGLFLLSYVNARTVAANTWYFAAITFGATTTSVYVRTPTTGFSIASKANHAAGSGYKVFIGNDSPFNDGAIKGITCGVKVWDVDLSPLELYAESLQLAPVRFADLTNYLPLRDAGSLTVDEWAGQPWLSVGGAFTSVQPNFSPNVPELAVLNTYTQGTFEESPSGLWVPAEDAFTIPMGPGEDLGVSGVVTPVFEEPPGASALAVDVPLSLAPPPEDFAGSLPLEEPAAAALPVDVPTLALFSTPEDFGGAHPTEETSLAPVLTDILPTAAASVPEDFAGSVGQFNETPAWIAPLAPPLAFFLSVPEDFAGSLPLEEIAAWLAPTDVLAIPLASTQEDFGGAHPTEETAAAALVFDVLPSPTPSVQEDFAGSLPLEEVSPPALLFEIVTLSPSASPEDFAGSLPLEEASQAAAVFDTPPLALSPSPEDFAGSLPLEEGSATAFVPEGIVLPWAALSGEDVPASTLGIDEPPGPFVPLADVLWITGVNPPEDLPAALTFGLDEPPGLVWLRPARPPISPFVPAEILPPGVIPPPPPPPPPPRPIPRPIRRQASGPAVGQSFARVFPPPDIKERKKRPHEEKEPQPEALRGKDPHPFWAELLEPVWLRPIVLPGSSSGGSAPTREREREREPESPPAPQPAPEVAPTPEAEFPPELAPPAPPFPEEAPESPPEPPPPPPPEGGVGASPASPGPAGTIFGALGLMAVGVVGTMALRKVLSGNEEDAEPRRRAPAARDNPVTSRASHAPPALPSPSAPLRPIAYAGRDFFCERCGHAWTARGPKAVNRVPRRHFPRPLMCPQCRSTYWDKPPT